MQQSPLWRAWEAGLRHLPADVMSPSVSSSVYQLPVQDLALRASVQFGAMPGWGVGDRGGLSLLTS